MILLLALFTTLTFAQWSPEAQKQVSEFNKQPVGIFQETFLNCLIDDLKLRLHSFQKRSTPYFGVKTLSIDLGQSFMNSSGETLPFRYYLFENSKGSTGTTVYLPGIFQGLDDEMTYKVVELLLQSGRRVLMIPNPLSPEYLKNYPQDFPGSFHQEAQIIYRILKSHRSEISELVGLSYGAFLSAMVASLDSNSEKFLRGQTTLLFPPFNINESIASLDEIMEESEVFFKGPKALVGGGFYTYLERTHGQLKAIHQDDLQKGFKRYPFSPGDRRKLRFSEFNRSHSLKIPEDQLMYWMNANWIKDNKRMRVLTSQDDYINHRNRFQPSEHVQILKFGGHVGVLSMEWFSEFLRSEINGRK
jgi:hypothetical protein